jgi:hypothetical protein
MGQDSDDEVYTGTAGGGATGGASGGGGGAFGATPDMMGGAGVSMGNGVFYEGLDATNILSNPQTMLDAVLRGQNQYTPASVAYYSDAYGQGFEPYAWLSQGANLNTAKMQQYFALLGQAEAETDPVAQQELLTQANQVLGEAGFSNQVAANLGQDYLTALQGPGIDAQAMLTQLMRQGRDPENVMNIMLSSGSESEQVNSAIDMINGALVTSNPIMAKLFMALVSWMGRQYLTDPRANRANTNFLDYLAGDYRGPSRGAIQMPQSQGSIYRENMVNQ